MKKILFVLSMLASVFISMNAEAQCCKTSAFGSATASATCGTTISITTCQYATERATLNSIVAGRTYRVNSSVATDWVTVRSGSTSCTAPVVYNGPQGGNWVATVSGTYYAHFSTNSSCGNASTCRATSLTTVSGCTAPSGCANTSSFGSATINTAGTAVTISTCSYAGEYSTVSGAVSGQTLRFTSSVATDYITIRSGSPTGTIVAQGTTPLQFNNTFTGTLYAHWNTNSACGSQSACRTTTVQCMSCTPPPSAANDNCSGATPLSCGGTATVNTTAANTDASGSNFCGTTITTPGVWYSIAGNGQNMTVSTVGLTSVDTKLMVFSGSCAALTCVGGNDDSGGLQSSVSWSSVSGTTYYVLAAAYTGTASFPMSLTCNAPVVNPCASITNLTCGVNSSYTLASGTGVWDNLGGPFTTPGTEGVFSYTPTTSGAVSISVSSSGSYVDLYWKTGTCGSTGWTYLNDILSTAETSTITVTAGTTYYFLLDGESTNAVSGIISVSCPQQAVNPCTSISALSSCGSSATSFSLPAGNGAWILGPYSTVGQEKIYSFTPTATASYPVTVTHNGSGWVDLFWKVAGTCDGTGWTYVNDVANGTETSAITFTAGVTYYILLDDEDTGGSTGSIQIGCPDSDGDGVADNVDACPTVFGTLSNGCPCIGSAVDGTYNYSSPITITGTTVDACDNSSLRAGYDRIYAINIPCAGTYTFSLCNGASWDTYLTLSSASGSGLLQSNDDFCGLQSQITYAVTAAGTYYIAVEPYSSGTTGTFTLSIQGTGSVPTLSGTTTNVTCNGGSNGSVNVTTSSASAVTYSWSNGATTEDLSNVAAGTYTVTASNCWGSTTATYTVTQPTAISVSVASNVPSDVVCYEGEATLTGTVIGGAGTLNYGWEVYDENGGSWVNLTSTQGISPVTESIGTGALYANTLFRLVATDAIDATCSANAEITIAVVEDPTLSFTTTDYNGFGVSCNGSTDGAIVSDIQGGLPVLYNYSWDNGATTANISGVAGGTYTLTADGLYGCNATNSATLVEPAPVTISISATEILCNGGTSTVTVTADGGTNTHNGIGSFGHGAGTYTYTVTDDNGCSATGDITITEPTALTLSLTGSDYNGYGVSCFGSNDGSVTSTVGGGTPGYSYSWNTGDSNADLSGLTEGTYAVTVTDANGCTISESTTLVEPTKVTISATNTAILCNGQNSDVTVVTGGGVQPYSVDDAGTYSVPAGSYTYNVVDANGCSGTTDITITQPTALVVNAGGDEVTYYGYGPAQCANLEMTISGGTAGYSSSWSSVNSGGGVGTTLTACPTNNEVYTATVVDANGCVATDDLSICVVNVQCTAGQSGQFKVEICQIPPGNPSAAHTICVFPSAVPAHLAIGCQLGACGELAQACGNAAAKSIDTDVTHAALTVAPNPTDNFTTISLTLSKAGDYNVVMFDMMGQKVMEVFNGNFGEYENMTFDVDMSSLENGIYMVGVSNGEQMIENIRIVKQ